MPPRKDQATEQLLVTMLRHLYREVVPACDSLKSLGSWRPFTVQGTVTRETIEGQLLVEHLLAVIDCLVQAVDSSARTESKCGGIRDFVEQLEDERKREALSMSLEESVRQHARFVLAAVRGNKAAAARVLEMSRGTLCRLLSNEYGTWKTSEIPAPRRRIVQRPARLG